MGERVASTCSCLHLPLQQHLSLRPTGCRCWAVWRLLRAPQLEQAVSQAAGSLERGPHSFAGGALTSRRTFAAGLLTPSKFAAGLLTGSKFAGSCGRTRSERTNWRQVRGPQPTASPICREWPQSAECRPRASPFGTESRVRALARCWQTSCEPAHLRNVAQQAAKKQPPMRWCHNSR